MKKNGELILFFNKEEDKFETLYLFDEADTVKLSNERDIYKFLRECMEKNGVSTLNDIPGLNLHTSDDKLYKAESLMCEEKFNDVNLKKMKSDVSKIAEEPVVKDDNTKYVLVKDSEYNGKKTSGIKKGAMIVAVAGLVIALATGAFHLNSKLNASKNNTASDEKIEQEDKVNEKVALESWEQYVAEAPETAQKDYFINMMKEIEDNVVDITIKDTTYKVGLTPYEKLALDIYYNSYKMSENDMFELYGNYNMRHDDIITNSHSAFNKARLSFVYAKSEKDIIHLNFKDQKVNAAYEKLANVFVKFNNATNDQERANFKKEYEETLKLILMGVDSLDASKNPAAQALVTVTVSAANLSAMGPLDEDLNKLLVGLKDNQGVPGVENTQETAGSFEKIACDVLNTFNDSWDEFTDKLSDPNAYTVEGKSTAGMLEEWLKSNYPVPEIIDLMTKKLSYEFEQEIKTDSTGKLKLVFDDEESWNEMKYANIDELKETIQKGFVGAPGSGGGSTELPPAQTEHGVSVTAAEVGAAQIQAAQAAAEAQFKAQEQQAINNANAILDQKEAEIKQQNAVIESQAGQVISETFTPNPQATPAVGTVITDSQGNVVGEYAGDTSMNPNQNGGLSQQQSPTPVQPVTPAPQPTPQQGQPQSSVTTSVEETVIFNQGYIQGTATEDATGAVTPEDMMSSENFNSVDAIVEYMATQVTEENSNDGFSK